MIYSLPLKNKLRHIKICKEFIQKLNKQEVVRSIPSTGVKGKTFIEKMQKQSKEIDLLYLKQLPFWESLVGCL